MKLKERLILAEHFLYKKLKAAVGSFKLIASRFEFLYLCHEVTYDRVVALNVRHKAADFFKNHTAACNLAHKEDAAITYRLRFDMLVGKRIFENGVYMHSGLVNRKKSSVPGRPSPSVLRRTVSIL